MDSGTLSPRGLVLLDACAVINLYASRWMEDIVGAVGVPVGVVRIVHQESLYVLHGGEGDDADERVRVDLSPLIAGESLLMLDLAGNDELETFIDLTADLDDGEAMTLALAVHRGCTVVTDDRKAARIATSRGVELRATLDLVKAWVDGRGIALEVTRSALLDIRRRGSYMPGRSHPLKSWWDRVLEVGQL